MEPNALTNEFKEFLKLLNDHEVVIKKSPPCGGL